MNATIYKTTVLVSELQAMRLFASEDESRYVLNGVLVEIWPDKTLLVATDGRRLGVLNTRAEQRFDNADKASFIIPSERLERLKPVPRYETTDEKNVLVLTFEQDGRDCGPTRITIDHEGAMMQLRGEAIPKAFPEWRQVIPTGQPKPAPLTAFNSDFFADLSKVAKLLGSDDLVFVARGYHDKQSQSSGAYELRLAGVPNFYCVLMPAKTDNAPERQQWLGLTERKAAA